MSIEILEIIYHWQRLVRPLTEISLSGYVAPSPIVHRSRKWRTK